MKKLELVGIIMVAVATVLAAIVNGGTDIIAAIAFTPVMILAALRYAPCEGAWWLFARGLTFFAAFFCGLAAVFSFGITAGTLHDVLPTHLLVGYAVAALCGLVGSYGLIVGGNEILGVNWHAHRYAHPHARS